MLTKSSRPKLKLHLQIHELSSIPLVTGQVFVKWHILHSSSGECRGKTDRAPIVDHKSGWADYRRECAFKVGIGRNGVLQERMLMMEVWVEMISGRERFRIGTVAVNLSEYASVKSETRRYLLQESKMNSTVKVTIAVVHVEGIRDYTTPPLKKAQMFHGITNLLAENKDLPQISRGIEQHNTKHVLHSPTQEMYRRTFSAQWRLQAGELPPSDVVEDIFKGGSGWKSGFAPSIPKIPERKLNPRTESGTSVRPSVRELRRPLSGQYSTSYSTLRRTHIPFNRPITPSSPDDQSDFDEDDAEYWVRQDPNSHRTGHFRTASIVSITPRQRKRNRERENVITCESWEKEELETGPRSWKTPDLDELEEKIQARRVARESRSTTTNGSFVSAPGSSGKVSSTDRSASLSGSIISEVIVEDDEKEEKEENSRVMSADDTDTSD